MLSTCNRVEIYAEVGKFHGAVAAICELLSRHSHVPPGELTPCLYVHYEDRAVQHLLAVACGLDSMVIGESQILGQLRQSLRMAREQGTLGRTLSDLGSRGAAGRQAGAIRDQRRRGGRQPGQRRPSGCCAAPRGRHRRGCGSWPSRHRHCGDTACSHTARHWPGKRVLVVGAGAMSGLAVAKRRQGRRGQIVVTSRTRQRAERLAASAGGRAADMSDLADLIAAADLVVTCTGAPGHVITADMVQAALRLRAERWAAAWCCSTWRCRATSSPAVAAIAGVALPIWRRWPATG